MTEKSIDYISVTDNFWIQLKSHLITFGFKRLPKGTHLTLSFKNSDPDINFHVTKNSKNSNDKPQIKIAVIEKKHLEDVIHLIWFEIIDKVLLPLDINKLKAKSNNYLRFISFESLRNSGFTSLVEQSLIKELSFSLKRKTRIKFEGDVEKDFENVVVSEDLRESFLELISNLPEDFEESLDSGIILTDDEIVEVIIINGNWFTLRTDTKLVDILSMFINPQLAKCLIWKTKRAVIAVKHAKKYSDTKHLNMPIRLVWHST